MPRRALAGFAAVVALKILARLPPNLIVALGSPFLPCYALIRRDARHRLRRMRGHVPFDVPTPLAYYRMRLRLAALSLRHFTGRIDDLPVRIEGKEHYQTALADGKTVALLGWHQGPVELLHRLPTAPDEERPFFILTGKGFDPLLTRMLQRGRRQSGKQIVEPEARSAALRAWIRRRGVLALMLDQVPGNPVEWLSLWNGAVNIPFPRNLWKWMGELETEFLAVSARLETNQIVFEYHPLVRNGENGLRNLMEAAIAAAPEQYNWSYPKIQPAPRVKPATSA